MTPRVRNAALLTAAFLAALTGFALWRGARTRAQAAPLTQALLALSAANFDALNEFMEAIAAHRDDCTEAERVASARLTARRSAAAARFAEVERLRASMGRAESNAAARMAWRPLRDAQLVSAAHSQALLDVLHQFKKACPDQAVALDAVLAQYAGAVNVRLDGE